MPSLLARLIAPWSEHETRINTLEATMATTDELVSRLSAATDEIANDLKSLRDEVAASDSAAAAKFEPLISRLEAMGADSNDPVPADGGAPVEPTPEPAPSDGGDTPVADEPAGDQPA